MSSLCWYIWTFNLRLQILIRQYMDCYLPVFFCCMRELWSKSPSGRLIKDSTFPLWHLIKLSLEASGLVFSEVMNYSPSSWQMKRLASCPRSAWYLTACLLCTPGSVCTINTAVVVTAWPPRGGNELQPQHHQHPHHWHTGTHLPGESRYLCTCGRRSLSHVTSFPKEETRGGSIDSLFLSSSSFRSIMLLDQPRITVAQLLPLDDHFLIPLHVQWSPQEERCKLFWDRTQASWYLESWRIWTLSPIFL